MVGRPNIRIKRLTASLTEALAAGRRDEAMMLFAEVRRVASEAGLPTPDLPQEATDLWLQVTESIPVRDPVQKPVETKLSDITRQTLVQAGDLAAQHMLDLMQAPGLFVPLGIIPIDRQVATLNLVMGRAFGAMPLGAQRVNIKPGDVEPEQPAPSIQATLSMMIRNRQSPTSPQAQAPAIRDITPPNKDEDAA
jgi:hypothetical protein